MKRGEIWTVAGGAAARNFGGVAAGSEELKMLNRALFVFLGLSETEREAG